MDDDESQVAEAIPSEEVAAETGGADVDDDASIVDKRMSAMSISDIGTPGSTATETLHVTGTDRYFVPLRLACESKQSRIMEVPCVPRAGCLPLVSLCIGKAAQWPWMARSRVPSLGILN